jgi:hypothetical protein
MIYTESLMIYTESLMIYTESLLIYTESLLIYTESLMIYTELAGIRNSFFYFHDLIALVGAGLLIVEVGHT